LKKVFKLIITALIVVSIIDIAFNYVFRHAPWGIYKKLHTIIETNDYYDVWIIGSSRAETAFETNLLSLRTGLTFFNAGIHGAKTQQTYYLLKHIFSQHPLPKYVFLDIDIHNLETIDTLLNIEQFAPFMYVSSLRKDFSNIDKRITYAYYFPMYELSFYRLRGTSKFLRILFNKPGRYDTTFQTTGCYHSHTDYQASHYPDTTHRFYFHPFNLMYIDSIITICQKYNVALITTVSPIYLPDDNIFYAVKEISNYFQNKDILLLNFSIIQPLSFQQEKFSDKYHLKFNGSVEFTNLFCDSIMRMRLLK